LQGQIPQSPSIKYIGRADYVASLSIVAGQMLAHIAIGHKQDSILMLEGLEIGKHRITVDSHLAGKSMQMQVSAQI